MDQADALWLAAVSSGHPSGEFGHREHLRLAWLVLEGSESVSAAVGEVSDIIRRIAETQGVPQRYNQTVTCAWVLIVHHVRANHHVQDFDQLLAAAPWLSDKRLLLRHYRSRTLASTAARISYVPPDLLAIPA
jgi:hypothetical protein